MLHLRLVELANGQLPLLITCTSSSFAAAMFLKLCFSLHTCKHFLDGVLVSPWLYGLVFSDLQIAAWGQVVHTELREAAVGLLLQCLFVLTQSREHIIWSAEVMQHLHSMSGLKDVYVQSRHVMCSCS